MVIWVTGGIIERFQVLPFYRFRKKGSRFSREKNELDNILEYRYEKKKKFAVEKAVDILVNHTTPFRAFLPSTVICFIQILNNRSIPLHRYIHQRSTWTLSPYFSLLEKVIFGGERHHNTTFFNPFSLSLSILPRGGVVSYLAATVREDWSRKRDSSPRRTRIPNQNNNRIKHTQQLDQSFLCFKKYLDIWWLHNHTYRNRSTWLLKRFLYQEISKKKNFWRFGRLYRQ